MARDVILDNDYMKVVELHNRCTFSVVWSVNHGIHSILDCSNSVTLLMLFLYKFPTFLLCF